MQVGFAGLGRMGVRMARNLVQSGIAVTVWTRNAEKARAFSRETGCLVADTPRALAESCDVVLTMLSDDPSSEAVHNGPKGLFAGPASPCFIEMGTMSPGHIAHLAATAPKGALVIDAPVSGATQAAEDAALLIMAGCAEEDGAALAPLFDALGKRTIWLGSQGAGAVMKLSVNSLIHGLNQTLAEAMTLAEGAGIAPEAAFDVIEASAAGAPMLKYRRPLYLDETSHEVTFTIALARKDMEATEALARQFGVAMPQGRETLARLKDAEARGYGARDMAAMLDYMRKEMS